MTQLRSKTPALAVIAFVLVYGAAGMWTAQRADAVDFTVYYLSARAQRDGADIYALSDGEWASLAAQSQISNYTKPYLYPPFTAGFVSLFADLPFRPALLVWNVLSIGALFASGWVLSRLTSARRIDPLVFAALTTYAPLWTTVYAGQVNAFVLLGVTLYVWWLKHNRSLAAGFALSGSLIVKPLAAPLLVHLLWRREARKFAAVVIGLGAWLVVTAALTGPESLFNYAANTGQLSTLSIEGAVVTYPPNQSLFGFFGRLLTANEYGASLADNETLARVLSITAAVLLLLGVVILTWPRAGRTQDSFALETGLVLVTINLVIPTSWYHHAAISIIPLLLAWHSTRLRVWLVAAFVLIDVQGLLQLLEFTGHALLLSLGTYGLIIVYAVTAIAVWRSRRRETTPTR